MYIELSGRDKRRIEPLFYLINQDIVRLLDKFVYNQIKFIPHPMRFNIIKKNNRNNLRCFLIYTIIISWTGLKGWVQMTGIEMAERLSITRRAVYQAEQTLERAIMDVIKIFKVFARYCR